MTADDRRRLRSPMSIQAMAWVLSSSRSEGSDRLVLMAIANHADANGTSAYPNAERIAEEARVDRATVYRALQRLVALGELVRESGGGRGRSNRYTVLLKPSHAKPSQGSQDATVSEGKGSHLVTQTVASDHINSRNGATRTVLNRPEPKTAIEKSGNVNGQVKTCDGFPERCATCGHLAYDCLCDRGALIKGRPR